MYLNLLGTGFPALTPELGYLGNHTSKTNDNIFSFLKVVIIPSPYLVALDETYDQYWVLMEVIFTLILFRKDCCLFLVFSVFKGPHTL